MKRFFVIIVLLAFVITGKSQVYIQTTLPTTGLVQINQLWNLVLINSSTGSIDAKLNLVLRDRVNGIELLTATSGRFTLSKGTMPVNISTLNPIQYNYLAVDVSDIANGLLPAGAYTACYSITRVMGEKQEFINEECVHFDIEPLSPPMLVYPQDSSELEAIPTQFTWTPPVPTLMLKRLQYEVLIAEVKPDQKAEEALQDNVSFYSTSGLTNNLLMYPASLPAFEKEKWYGWQVVARDGRTYAGKSEAWVFKVKKESRVELIIRGTPFVRMKQDNPELGIAPNGVLKLAYFNRTADSTARIILYDISESEEKGRFSSVIVPVVAGENQLQISLKRIVALSEDKIYRAEIVSSTGERSSMLFRIKNFEDK